MGLRVGIDMGIRNAGLCAIALEIVVVFVVVVVVLVVVVVVVMMMMIMMMMRNDTGGTHGTRRGRLKRARDAPNGNQPWRMLAAMQASSSISTTRTLPVLRNSTRRLLKPSLSTFK